MTTTALEDADRLAEQVQRDLPPAATWTMPPRGYREGLALCVIDGVTRQVSGGAAADTLVADFRNTFGAAAETSGVDVLAGALAENSSTPAWVNLEAGDARAVVAALLAAVEVLAAHGLNGTVDLVATIREQGLEGAVGGDWIGREPLTPRMWSDTAMLAGYFDPKVDQIIAAYVARAMGADPATTPPERVIAALTTVAERFESKILPLEFAILEHERGS